MVLSRSSITTAHRSFRPVPLVSGREEKKLKRKIWSEVVEGLKKDLPGVTDAVARQVFIRLILFIGYQLKG